MCLSYFMKFCHCLFKILKNQNIVDRQTDGRTDNVKTVCGGIKTDQPGHLLSLIRIFYCPMKLWSQTLVVQGFLFFIDSGHWFIWAFVSQLFCSEFFPTVFLVFVYLPDTYLLLQMNSERFLLTSYVSSWRLQPQLGQSQGPRPVLICGNYSVY